MQHSRPDLLAFARRYADFIEDAEEIARYYRAAQRGTPAAFLQTHCALVEFVVAKVQYLRTEVPPHSCCKVDHIIDPSTPVRLTTPMLRSPHVDHLFNLGKESLLIRCGITEAETRGQTTIEGFRSNYVHLGVDHIGPDYLLYPEVICNL
ncbi:hypothetical protein [Microvirga massiliensis]|uniref:hypothetical protein n=1 Tax=Microvirga massiliensis TaxID=1033741 RepID=UPI00062BEABC|nr:hypothetical protein [Microvirga massiliensis]